MHDELIQPSFAIHNSPGVYALLLGSGLSKPADIPTGNEVLEDLIHQLAIIKDDEVVSDPFDWYRKTFNKEPSYDGLLEQLGHEKTDRQALLQSYFEPTDSDIEEGRKLPTQAHHAIAWLVKHKFIRVIITTNFDRLIENAFKEVGIEPQVVTENSVAHMTPLQHTDVTIIKIHGDYLDANLKNTAEELSSYSEEIANLLQRVFTEYGLLICGWSGMTDKALRELLETKTSRYSTYFASYTVPENEAKKLLKNRNAVEINDIDGDMLFTEIKQMVISLSGIGKNQKLSTEMLINRIKRLLAHPNNEIEIEDIVRDELEQAIEQLARNLAEATLDRIREESVNNVQFFTRALQHYSNVFERVIQLVFIISRYTDGQFSNLLTRTIERTFDVDQPTLIWKFAPTMLLNYAIGFASVIGNNWKNIEAVFRNPYVEFSTPVATSSESYMSKLFMRFNISYHQEFENKRTSIPFMSELILQVLKPYYMSFENSDAAIIHTHDLFDMICALYYLKQNTTEDYPWTSVYHDPRSWNYLKDFWHRVHIKVQNSIVPQVFPDSDERHIYFLLKRFCDYRKKLHNTKPLVYHVDGFPNFFEQFETPEIIGHGYRFDP